MVKNKIILVTGAAGFIGANLVRKLLTTRNQIHALTREKTNLWRIKNVLSNVKLYNVPLEDYRQLKKIIKDISPQIIYHLAAYGNYSYHDDPLRIIRTNLIGTANLLRALNNIDYECFVNTGSSSEYGFKKKPMSESDILEPNSFYAASKASSTYLCQVFAKNYLKPIITLRPFSVYGPYEEPTRLIPSVITNILRRRSIKLTSKIARRDFIYIDDVIDLYLKIPELINKKIFGETFNIGTGKQYSNKDITKKLSKISKNKVPIVIGGYHNRSWDTNYWTSNIQKTEKLLRWKSKYSLTKGLTETFKWFNHYEYFKKIYK